MDRTADYTIQRFQYQFNKTLLEVLKSADDAKVNSGERPVLVEQGTKV